MARACSICARTDREAIDRAIVGGAPIRTLARQFSASRDALMRHRAHISEALIKVKQAQETAHGKSLLERLEALIVRTEQLLEAAEKSGAIGAALQAIAQMWKGLELYGKVTGELQSGPTHQTINVLQLPETALLISTVRDVFKDQPDKLALVAERLRLTE